MSNEIPAGRYVARAVGRAQFGGKVGSEQMGVRFQILNEGFEGRTAIWYQNIAASNPTGMEIAVRGLRDAGWSGEEIAEASADTGLGSVDVDLVISYRMWEGKEKMEVRVYGAGGGAMFKADTALDERGLTALNARMKGLALKFKPVGKIAASAPAPSFLSRPSQRPVPHDDLGGGADNYVPGQYDDADNDGREGYLGNGQHVEAPHDNGEIPNF